MSASTSNAAAPTRSSQLQPVTACVGGLLLLLLSAVLSTASAAPLEAWLQLLPVAAAAEGLSTSGEPAAFDVAAAGGDSPAALQPVSLYDAPAQATPLAPAAVALHSASRGVLTLLPLASQASCLSPSIAGLLHAAPPAVLAGAEAASASLPVVALEAAPLSICQVGSVVGL